MKRLFETDTIGTPPNGKLIVKVKDQYSEMLSKGGIILHNAAHEEAECDSEGYMLSEWIMREGEVMAMPVDIQTEDFDWEYLHEVEIGDTVHWPIVRFFDYPAFRIGEDIFLIVDYGDLIAKERDGELTPINGFYLFTKIKETVKALAYEVEKDTMWFKLEKKGVDVVYEDNRFNLPYLMNEGVHCLLIVPPYKFEGTMSQRLDKEYFLCQKRHILAACEPDFIT